MLPDSQAPQASGWRAASFAISTPQGRLTVDGIVRSPFGIDQRTIDEAGTRGWSVTHLPSGLAVVRQIKVLAVALAFVDRIAALTDWTVQEIRATPDLRAQVQTALDQAYDDFYRAASRRSRKIRPRPPEIGRGPVWHDRRPSVAKRILATTMVRIPSWHAAHAAIFPCYQTCSMTQKRLDARLSKVLKEELQS